MKTCPPIKQCVYSKTHFGHPVLKKVEIKVKTWILFYEYKCLFMVYKFHIVILVYEIHKMCTNRQLWAWVNLIKSDCYHNQDVHSTITRTAYYLKDWWSTSHVHNRLFHGTMGHECFMAVHGACERVYNFWKHIISCSSSQGLYSLSGRTSSARSREDSKLRYSGLNLSHRSEIWQAPRQHRCREAY